MTITGDWAEGDALTPTNLSTKGGGNFPDRTYNAGWARFGTSAIAKETRIQAAINQAVADGVPSVFIPASMLPYDASAVTFNAGVRLIREGGRPDVYDVLAYGARFDGTGDSRLAFQVPLNHCLANGGGVVYAPEGNYLIGGDDGTGLGGVTCLTIGQRTTLMGSGWSTVLTAKTGTNYDSLIFLAQSPLTWGARISSLMIDGNKAGQTGGTGRGVHFFTPGGSTDYPAVGDTGNVENADNLLIVNTYGDGLFAWSTVRECKVTDVMVHGANGTGVFGFNDSKLVNVTVGYVGKHGFDQTSVADTQLTNCKCYRWGVTTSTQAAFRVNNRATLTNCFAEQGDAGTGGYYGFEVVGSDNNLVGVYASGCLGPAYQLNDNASNNIVIGKVSEFIVKPLTALTFAGHASYNTIHLTVEGAGTQALFDGSNDGTNDLQFTSSLGSNYDVPGRQRVYGNLISAATANFLNPILERGSQVVGPRVLGWGAPTGTPTRTTFDTASVTLPDLAERVKAIIDDLMTHGLIGPTSSFSPVSVGGVRLWVAADQLAGFSDGSSVSLALDGSGWENNLTQTTAANQPTYKTNIVNGLPVLRFASGDFLRAAFSLPQPCCVFVVFNMTNTGTVQQDLVDGANNASMVMGTINAGGGHMDIFAGTVLAGPVISAATWYVGEAVFDGVSSLSWINGAGTTGDAGTADAGGLSLGARFNGGDASNCDIPEVIAISPAPSLSDRNTIRFYLGTKYGITVI